MKRLIILEGVDCTGKTTLAQTITKDVSGFYIHATASKKLFPALVDYHANLLKIAKINIELGKFVILDRFWPSEYVYGKLFRPGSDYWDSMESIRQATESLGVQYVHCSSDNAWARYQQGNDDPAHLLNKKQFEMVADRYIGIMLELQALPYTIERYGDEAGQREFLDLLKRRCNFAK